MFHCYVSLPECRFPWNKGFLFPSNLLAFWGAQVGWFLRSQLKFDQRTSTNHSQPPFLKLTATHHPSKSTETALPPPKKKVALKENFMCANRAQLVVPCSEQKSGSSWNQPSIFSCKVGGWSSKRTPLESRPSRGWDPRTKLPLESGPAAERTVIRTLPPNGWKNLWVMSCWLVVYGVIFCYRRVIWYGMVWYDMIWYDMMMYIYICNDSY